MFAGQRQTREDKRAIHSRFELLRRSLSAADPAAEHGDQPSFESIAARVEELQRLVDSALKVDDSAERKIGLPVLNDRRSGAPRAGSADFPIRQIIESLDHPFLILDARSSEIVLANTAAWDCGPRNSRHCYELTHHRATRCDSAEHPCPLEVIRRTGKHCRVEHVHYDAEGRERNVEVHGAPVLDSEGRLTHMIEYSIDITDRKEAEKELSAARDLLVFSMAKLTESRDPETGAHLERMRAYSMIVSEELAREGPYSRHIDGQFLKSLYRSAPLHDIGKVGIPDAILLKPGQLTSDEFEVMKQHAEIGWRALSQIAAGPGSAGFLGMAARIARSHHERFDGSGYPDGLGGEAIPLEARIVAIADVFDALSSARVYKRAFEPIAARNMIMDGAGKHFDPEMTAAFSRVWVDVLAVMEAHRDS